jgi:hypothetical protein
MEYYQDILRWLSDMWTAKIAMTELNTIPKEDFQRCFQQWKDRWARCVEAQGAH